MLTVHIRIIASKIFVNFKKLSCFPVNSQIILQPNKSTSPLISCNLFSVRFSLVRKEIKIKCQDLPESW